MFAWVSGSSIPKPQLLREVRSYVEMQLEASQLLLFLKELRSHVRILQNPDESAHAGWAEMYDGRFIPAIKQALEEDDDERGGIQQIVRCTMKTIASACAVPTAARIFLYMGGSDLLQSFGVWAETAPWTSHAWMREETLEWVGEAKQLLEQSMQGGRFSSLEQISEDQDLHLFSASLQVRLEGGCTLFHQPSLGSPAVAKVPRGQALQAEAHKGLWIRVTHHSAACWLHGYTDEGHVCDITYWDLKAWQPEREDKGDASAHGGTSSDMHPSRPFLGLQVYKQDSFWGPSYLTKACFGRFGVSGHGLPRLSRKQVNSRSESRQRLPSITKLQKRTQRLPAVWSYIPNIAIVPYT